VAGQVVEGVTVATTYDSAGNAFASSTSDASGRYRLFLDPGAYTLYAFDSALRFASQTTTADFAMVPAAHPPSTAPPGIS
jgi:hypothetical protein